VRSKKEAKKSQATCDVQQSTETQWTTSTGATANDDLVVYHVRADGTQECYVETADGVMRAAAADEGGGSGQVTERDVLLSTLAEQTRSVTQLRLQLLNARGRVSELEQQNALLRQLLRDAQLTTR